MITNPRGQLDLSILQKGNCITAMVFAYSKLEKRYASKTSSLYNQFILSM
jgi:hypothetical protein